MSKYQQAFQQMLEQNKDLFTKFRTVHDAYALDPTNNKAEFNEIGRDVMDTIMVYERRLLSHMSAGQYGKFSGNVSEKFWDEARKVFPKINFIGVL